MSAYIIVTKRATRSQADLDEYLARGGATLAGHDVQVLAAYGRCEALEGCPIEGAVVMAFQTYQAALDWYNGPAYTAIKGFRTAGGDFDAILVDGIIDLPTKLPAGHAQSAAD